MELSFLFCTDSISELSDFQLKKSNNNNNINYIIISCVPKKYA